MQAKVTRLVSDMLWIASQLSLTQILMLSFTHLAYLYDFTTPSQMKNHQIKGLPFFFFFKSTYLFEREEREPGKGQRERKRKCQADTVLIVETDPGLNLTSGNQKSDMTEPPRRPERTFYLTFSNSKILRH